MRVCERGGGHCGICVRPSRHRPGLTVEPPFTKTRRGRKFWWRRRLVDIRQRRTFVLSRAHVVRKILFLRRTSATRVRALGRSAIGTWRIVSHTHMHARTYAHGCTNSRTHARRYKSRSRASPPYTSSRNITFPLFTKGVNSRASSRLYDANANE